MTFGICDFCGGVLDERSRCDTCSSVWPAGKLRDFEIGKNFQDYSYNRYQGFVGGVYRAWTRIGVWGFLGRSWQSRLFGWLLTPLQGGRGAMRWQEPSRILDVGCGRGAFLKEGPENWTKTGTDIVDYKQNGLRIFVGPFEEQKFSEKFDIVRSWHSLEHSYKPTEFLEKMESLVATDGVIIVSTPNSDSLSARIFGDHWLPYGVDTHYWIPTRQALETWFTSRGWTICYSSTYSYFTAAGSLATKLRLGNSVVTLIPLILITLPLIIMEQVMGRGDSLVIYAKRKN